MTGGFDFAFAAFGVYLILTALLLRLVARSSPAWIAVATSVVIFAVGLAVPLLFGHTVLFWRYSAAYWCAVGAFLMVFGALHKSVSLHMLSYLVERPGFSADYDHMMRECVTGQTFESRLVVIQESGFALRTSEGFELTARGRRLARTMRGLQALFAVEKSG